MSLGLRVNRQQHAGIQTAKAGLNAGNHAGIHRRDAATTTTTVINDSVKQKTMDDLGGPSLMSTLNWLFVKGYFKKAQQMQVRGGILWMEGRLCCRSVSTCPTISFIST